MVRALARLLRSLEDRVEADLAGRREVTLAFSAGASSTLLAAIARKRCALTCVVVGTHDAPDVRAAQVAASYLDHAVTPVTIDVDRGRSAARRIASETPALRRSEVLALVPAAIVRERVGSDRVLAGFGTGRLRPTFRRAISDLGLDAPILRTPGLRARVQVMACGGLLGLPPAFARPRRRVPIVGCGLEDAFPGRSTR